MNLDRLKALIRLANNNPNENEANLAARKVCSVIAEEDFALLKNQFYQPTKKQEDFVNDPRARTWNDVKRSTEPEWRSKPPSTVDADYFNEFFRKHGINFGGFRPSEAQKRSWTDSAPHQNAPKPNWTGPEYVRYNPFTDEKKAKPQAMRKCTECGFEVMTFRINEVPYVCNPCHWKEKT